MSLALPEVPGIHICIIQRPPGRYRTETYFGQCWDAISPDPLLDGVDLSLEAARLDSWQEKRAA